MKADRILTLDIGADGIRMAVVADAATGAPRMLDSGFAAFDHSLSLPKEAITAMTLKQLLDEKKPAVKNAVLSIEGQAVFSRLVRLPMVGKDQVEKTIRHEAVQNIPFPIDEVVWDAHVFDPESAEPEVLLVAVKAELIEGLVDAVRANGLVIDRISVAPAALANAAHTFCDTAEPLLLVDRGPVSTNLVFIDGRRVFFRSLPVAGDDAGRRRREIERSISFYTGQQGGQAPRQQVDSAELDGVESGYAVCMGLACSPAVEIDLIPPSLSRARNVQQRQPLWFACIGLLIVLLAVWVVNLDARIRHTASALEQTEQQAEMLEQWEEQLVPIEKRIEALNRQAGLYARLLNERYRWADVLNELNAVLPDGMFLLNSEPIRPMDRVAGIRIAVLSYLDKEAEDADAVKQLRDALRASPLFSAQTKVFSRPSKKEFAREFVLDVYFAEEQP